MRAFKFGSAVVLSLCALISLGASSVDVAYQLAPRAIVEVRVRAGTVSVSRSDDGLLRVEGAPVAAEGPEIRVEHGRAGVVVSTRREVGRYEREVELEVQVPEGIRKLIVRGEQATVSVEDVNAEVDARTTGGDLAISVPESRGRITASTTSGEIAVASELTERVTIRTVSGNVDLDAPAVRSLTIRTNSGNVDLAVGAFRDGTIDVHSTRGDIRAEFGDRSAVWVRIPRGSGSVEPAPEAAPGAGLAVDSDRFSVSYRIGAGFTDARIGSLAGDVAIQVR